MRFIAETLTYKFLRLAIHPTTARIDNGQTSSLHYVAVTFALLSGWAEKLPLGRVSCQRKAAHAERT